MKDLETAVLKHCGYSQRGTPNVWKLAEDLGIPSTAPFEHMKRGKKPQAATAVLYKVLKYLTRDQYRAIVAEIKNETPS